MKFKYSGAVKIRYMINGEVIESFYHNEGLEPLFKYIARALCGENVSNDRPIALDLRKLKDGVYTSLLNTKSMLSGLYYTMENGEWVTKITAVISYSQLNTASLIMIVSIIYICVRRNMILQD